MSKHTSGPWVVEKQKGGTYVMAPAGIVAEMLSGYQGQRDANARLISQAPRLLEALKKAINLLPTDHGMPTPLFEECFEAIHDAEED